MTLSEKLNSLSPDELVFIGSRSAFFFIGTPTDFMKLVPEFNTNWYANFKRTLERSKVAFEKHRTTIPAENTVEYKKVTDHQLHRTISVPMSYQEILNLWTEKLVKLKESVEHSQKIIDSWKPFQDRKVVACYPNIERNATIIVVEGWEVARFWFKHEFDEAMSKKTHVFDYSEPEGEDEDEDIS